MATGRPYLNGQNEVNPWEKTPNHSANLCWWFKAILLKIHFVTALGDLIPKYGGEEKTWFWHHWCRTTPRLPVIAGHLDFSQLIHISLNPRYDWRITCKPLLATQPPEGVFLSRDPTKKHHLNFQMGSILFLLATSTGFSINSAHLGPQGKPRYGEIT